MPLDKDSVIKKVKELYGNYGIEVCDDDIKLAVDLYLKDEQQLKIDLKKSRKFKDEQEKLSEED